MSTNDKKIMIELKQISESNTKKCWLIKSESNSCEIYMIENIDRILPLIDHYLRKKVA